MTEVARFPSERKSKLTGEVAVTSGMTLILPVFFSQMKSRRVSPGGLARQVGFRIGTLVKAGTNWNAVGGGSDGTFSEVLPSRSNAGACAGEESEIAKLSSAAMSPGRRRAGVFFRRKEDCGVVELFISEVSGKT